MKHALARLHPTALDARDAFSRTGFSREEASACNLNFAARHPTLSRLKPLPQWCSTASPVGAWNLWCNRLDEHAALRRSRLAAGYYRLCVRRRLRALSRSTVGARLPANAVGQSTSSFQTPRVRQQAGSYRFCVRRRLRALPRSIVGPRLPANAICQPISSFQTHRGL